MEKELLDKLKSKLPRGYAKKVAKKCEVTPESVRQILRGEFNNEKVIEELLELANQYQEKLKKIKKEIGRL